MGADASVAQGLFINLNSEGNGGLRSGGSGVWGKFATLPFYCSFFLGRFPLTLSVDAEVWGLPTPTGGSVSDLDSGGAVVQLLGTSALLLLTGPQFKNYNDDQAWDE